MLKKIITGIFNLAKKSANTLTIKRKEGHAPIERVTLIERTSKEYCENREKRLKATLIGLSQR